VKEYEIRANIDGLALISLALKVRQPQRVVLHGVPQLDAKSPSIRTIGAKTTSQMLQQSSLSHSMLPFPHLAHFLTKFSDNAGVLGITIKSNKSLIGQGSKGVIKGKGIRMVSGAKNIIVQ
jgi:pectate lyase